MFAKGGVAEWKRRILQAAKAATHGNAGIPKHTSTVPPPQPALVRNMGSPNTEYYQISDRHDLGSHSGHTLLLGTA